MKKSEKETLKKAFNIPEPERKESFVSLYNQRLKKNERKFNLPVFFRYASTAVFAVLIIGLWGNLSKNADFRDKFNTVEEPTTAETVHTTTVTQLTEENDITTAETMTSQIVQTAVNSSATAVQTNKTAQTAGVAEDSPQTHVQVTMPEIPSFTPSMTAVTFPTKPETPTRTKPVYTSKAVSATTARKTTVASPISTHEGESPSLNVTTEQIFPLITSDNSPTDTDNFENNVTTVTQPPSADAPPSIVPQVTTENNYEPPLFWGNDYTVYPSKVYRKSANIIDLSDCINDNTAQVPNDSIDSTFSVDDLINLSDYIIFGKVDDIIYTQVNGKPYTQENITIYQVYKGNKLHEHDKISIYIPGGYMPVSEFESLNNIEISSYGKEYIYSSGGNKNHQTIGDIRIFFINDGGKYIPDGAFELTTKNDVSIFQASGGKYISSGNNALRFNIKSLLNI